MARPSLDHSCALDDVCLVEDELRLAGRSELDAAAARAQALIDEQAPGDDRLSVSTELTHGSVMAALQSLSQHAALLVMEHHGMGRDGETATFSATAAVAAAAHCPVVAVPEGWRPTAQSDALVVVGVEDPARDTVLLQTAADEADRRGARLCVVRAPVDDARHPTDVLHPEDVDLPVHLPVDVVVEEGPAHEVLLRHAAGAGLLVVGRHHRRHVIGAPLGRTARALLRNAAVPVLVVDPVKDGAVSKAASSAVSGGR